MAKETQPPQTASQASDGDAAPQNLPAPRRQMSSQGNHVFNVPKPGRPRPEHHVAKVFQPPRNVQVGDTKPSRPASTGAANGQLQGSDKPGSTNGFVNPNMRFQGASLQNAGATGLASATTKLPAPMPSRAIDDDLFAPIDAWSSQGNTRASPTHKPFSSFKAGFNSANAQHKASTGQPISRPFDPPNPGRSAAPKPFFSSGPAPFDPYRMPQNANVIDLTKPQFRSRKPEILDVEDYMDQDEANEKLKNLLEGNLGGEDVDEEDDNDQGLAESVKQSLSIKDEVKPPEKDEKVSPSDDDGSRDGLKVKLLTHQIVGVKWMNQKEAGKGKKKGTGPKGGILADDMGLGKTLQTIATIVTNPRPAKGSEEAKALGLRDSTSGGTLVVVPLPLLQQWEGEITKFVEPSLGYKVHVHYGPKRHSSGKAFEKSDVVLTTYETLVSDYGNSNFNDGGKRVACFEINWYRVVLDEAHRIKNPSTKQSKACCALNSHYRWCLTGTPMQNKLEEIQSLIRFLRIEPYNDIRHWKDQVTNPMNRGKGGVAMRRVQILLKAILLRRTKDLLREKGELKTVARKVEEVVAEFSPPEKTIYDKLEDRMANTIDRMGSKLNYANALVLLLRLRQACNHPVLVTAELGQDKDALTTGSGSSAVSPSKAARKDVDDLANMLDGLDMGRGNCQFCGAQLSGSDRSGTCKGCETDLNVLESATSSPAVRKPRRGKLLRKNGNNHRETRLDSDEDEDDAREESLHRKNNMRGNARKVLDSDDDEEGEGEWLVSSSRQGLVYLGKAGGTDDENAEGGGHWLGIDDSQSEDADSDDESDDSIVVRRQKGRSQKNPIDLEDTDEDRDSEHGFEDDDDSDDDSSDHTKAIKRNGRARPSGLDSDDDDQDSDASDDEARGSWGRGTKTARGGTSHPKASSSSTTSQPLTSAKIRALMKILNEESKAHKVIVFSSFVTMLRLIEPYLLDAGLRYVHYNGQMRNDMREASLEALRSDARTRVLLCSLKSGALGLNLTAASRVVIIEPFWNPFVEEQAIDRVHRIGQRHDVVVYKLTVGDTVEQRIVALQEKKRELAKMALESGHKVAGAGALTMKQVLALFRRDAEHDADGDGGGKDGGDGADDRFAESRGSLLRPTQRPRHNAKPANEERSSRRVEDPVWGRR